MRVEINQLTGDRRPLERAQVCTPCRQCPGLPRQYVAPGYINLIWVALTRFHLLPRQGGGRGHATLGIRQPPPALQIWLLPCHSSGCGLGFACGLGHGMDIPSSVVAPLAPSQVASGCLGGQAPISCNSRPKHVNKRRTGVSLKQPYGPFVASTRSVRSLPCSSHASTPRWWHFWGIKRDLRLVSWAIRDFLGEWAHWLRRKLFGHEVLVSCAAVLKEGLARLLQGSLYANCR